MRVGLNPVSDHWHCRWLTHCQGQPKSQIKCFKAWSAYPHQCCKYLEDNSSWPIFSMTKCLGQLNIFHQKNVLCWCKLCIKGRLCNYCSLSFVRNFWKVRKVNFVRQLCNSSQLTKRRQSCNTAHLGLNIVQVEKKTWLINNNLFNLFY